MSAYQTPPPFSPATVYATHVIGRRPEWKVHTSRGKARQAISYHGVGEVWESTPTGGWFQIPSRSTS